MGFTGYHYVKPENMNHHDSLYGGTMLDWLSEHAFYGACQVFGRQHGFVMCAFDETRFIEPTLLGSIVKFDSEPVKVGKSSLTMQVTASDIFENRKYAQCKVTFVNVDENGKSCPHNLSIKISDGNS